jgi:AraC-like DNA-binding protein
VEAIELCAGERVWYTRPPALEGVEVLHARESPRLWKLWHETYALCLTHRGGRSGAFWRYRNRDLTIGPGEVMLMEPREVHVTQRLEGKFADFDVLFLKPGLVEAIGEDLGLRGPFHVREARTDNPQLCTAVEALASAIYAGDALGQQVRLARVLRLVLSRFAEKRVEDLPALSKVQVTRVREFFETHYADSFDLDRIAQACRVSKSSICHSLPRSLGVTPRELQTLIRVHRAKELLARGIAACKVATQVGFADQAQLTRHFNRLYGVAPGRYARMVGAR